MPIFALSFSGFCAKVKQVCNAVVEDCCADNLEKHERTLDTYQFMFDRTTTDLICEQHSKWLTILEEMDEQGVPA